MFTLIAALLITAPNPQLTPGEVLPVTKASICQSGFPESVRHVNKSMKLKVCRAYGLPDCSGHVVDHLIPLAIGGASTPKNLWPEAIDPAKKKDALEVKYRKLLCNHGGKGLKEVQRMFLEEFKTTLAK